MRKKTDFRFLMSSGSIISRQIVAFELFVEENPEFIGDWQDVPSDVQRSYMSRVGHFKY